MLLAGIEIERVHCQYVIVAVELLTDAETQCVLAATGVVVEPERIRIRGLPLIP